jgi:hypothetical protein
MEYKARVNFSGNLSMNVGEIRKIDDVNIAKDLLRAGYIEEVKPAEKAKAETVKAQTVEAAKEEKPAKAEKKPTRAKKKG